MQLYPVFHIGWEKGSGVKRHNAYQGVIPKRLTSMICGVGMISFCLNCPTAWNSPRRCGQRIYGCRQCEIPELSASMLTGFFADLYSFPHYGDEHFGYEFLAISYFGRHQIGLCACFLHCFSYLPQKAPCHDRVIVDPQRQRSVADSSNLIPSSGSARRWRSASVRSLRTRNRDRGERCGKL